MFGYITDVKGRQAVNVNAHVCVLSHSSEAFTECGGYASNVIADTL